MRTKDFRAALAELGLTIVGAAPIIGISRRQSQRIAAGESPVPEPVAKLLRAMIKYKIKPDELK